MLRIVLRIAHNDSCPRRSIDREGNTVLSSVSGDPRHAATLNYPELPELKMLHPRKL